MSRDHMLSHLRCWADDEEYDSENEYPAEPPSCQEWMSLELEFLTDAWLELRNELHLTGILDRASINEFAEFVYMVGIRRVSTNGEAVVLSSDPLTTGLVASAFNTLMNFCLKEDTLRLGPEAYPAFTVFCRKFSSQW